MAKKREPAKGEAQRVSVVLPDEVKDKMERAVALGRLLEDPDVPGSASEFIRTAVEEKLTRLRAKLADAETALRKAVPKTPKK